MALTAALAASLLPRPAAAQTTDDESPMVVTGRLLDADGNPVAEGQVALVSELWCRTERPIGVYFHNGLPISICVTGPFRTDRAGRFQASGPAGPARPAWEVLAIGAALGHGHATIKVDKSARAQDVTIKLEQEHVIRGRLIDIQGQPAAGVTVRHIRESKMGTTLETLTPLDAPPPYTFPFSNPVTTDDKGRFLIRGLGKGKAWLEIVDPRFATQRVFAAQPSPRDEIKDMTFSLVAPRVVEGRVTYGKDGRPAAGARVVAVTGFDNVVQCLADADGRYSLNPFPGDSFSLTVLPPEGQPYRVWRKKQTFSQAARLEADVALERGVLVRGRVIETPSGNPVVNALVLYRPRKVNNPHHKVGFDYYMDWYRAAWVSAVSGGDGTFQIAVPPGPGHLFILGPTMDYVRVETSVGELEYGRPSMMRNYPDGLVALDLKPDEEVHEVTATLRRGVTLRAHIETPDGQPAGKLTVMSRSYLPTGWENWQQSWNILEVSDGELTLPGCDPEKGGIAWLFDAKHALGLTLSYSGQEASGPPRTVRLQPCGAATVRLLNREGKPIEKESSPLYVQFAPGTIMSANFLSGKDDHDLEGDWGFWVNYHFKREWESVDAEGRRTFSGLVPGLTYAVSTFDGYEPLKGQPKLEFQVKPGETLALPDFVIKK